MNILCEIATANDDVMEDVKVSFASWGDFAMGIRSRPWHRSWLVS